MFGSTNESAVRSGPNSGSNEARASKDKAMKAVFLNSRGNGRWSRLSRMGLTAIALTMSPFLPITPASSYHRADEPQAIASVPELSLATASGEHTLADAFARLPLRFEACASRTPAGYVAQTRESTIYISAIEATLLSRTSSGAGRLGCGADLGLPRNARSPKANEQLPEPRRDRAAPRQTAITTVRMQLLAANRRARVIGESQLATRTSYFIGKDASHWRSDVPNYARVKVEQVYRGIDIVYYGSGQQQLEYDFKVAPGADVRAIRLRFAGAQNFRLDEEGNLFVATAAGMLRQRKPIAYQVANGVRKDIAARYTMNSRHGVGLEAGLAVGDYDKSLPLVIDPELSYATYFGSPSGGELVSQIAFDSMGNAYIVGNTTSRDLATTPGALQSTNSGTGAHFDAFVAKLNATGTDVLYVTYLGGIDEEYGTGIAIDSKGNAYVAGTTFSDDFPTTQNAFQRKSPGPYMHAFVAKLNATGTALIYGTYLGAANENALLGGIAIDAAGEATVCGRTDSVHFPITPGAVQRKSAGDSDAFVARLSADGSALVSSTYLGGDGFDAAWHIALDTGGNAYVTGYTLSTDFPITRHAYQRQKERSEGYFVAKISSNGERLVYSTFIGNDAASTTGIAVDSSGAAYLTGNATANMPTTPGAIQSAFGGNSDAFVTKLNDTGSDLVYSTFLGGSGSDNGGAIAVDSLGQAYVTGSTRSADFPLMRPLQSRNRPAQLYKSTDSGSSWNDIPSAPQVYSLVVDPQVPSIFYGSTPSDIVKSTDSGATWRIVDPGISGSIVIDQMRPATLYSFSYKTIVKSTDGGANWLRIGPSSLKISFTALVLDPKASDTAYLGAIFDPAAPFSNVQALDAGTDVIFKSTNGGASWTSLDFGQAVTYVSCLAIDPRITSTIYAGAQSTTPNLLKSTDAGVTWFKPMASGTLFASQLIVDPTNSEILYAVGFSNISKSTDGGASWIPTALQQSGIAVIDPQRPSTLYVGNNAGLHQTTDGGASWRTTLDNIWIRAIALDPKQTSIIYAAALAMDEIFIAKLNTTGTALVYSTYLGGIGSDYGTSIAADDHGNAYVAGLSVLSDFPVTPNAYQSHGSNSYSGIVVRIADPAQPRIVAVTIKGKKLFVSGEGFDQGAVITINNVDLETENDGTTPATLLISKKGGKQIAPRQTVTIRVRDADGKLSDGFSFTRGAD